MNNPLTIDFKLHKGHIDQLTAIDRVVYHQEPDQNQMAIADRRPELYTIIRRGDFVIGYGLVLPLRKAVFKALKTGQIWEDEINLECLTERLPTGLYITAIATVPGASERERAMLVGSTVSPALRTPIETITVPISEAGDRICRNLLRMTPMRSRTELKGIAGYIPTIYTTEEPHDTR